MAPPLTGTHLGAFGLSSPIGIYLPTVHAKGSSVGQISRCRDNQMPPHEILQSFHHLIDMAKATNAATLRRQTDQVWVVKKMSPSRDRFFLGELYNYEEGDAAKADVDDSAYYRQRMNVRRSSMNSGSLTLFRESTVGRHVIGRSFHVSVNRDKDYNSLEWSGRIDFCPSRFTAVSDPIDSVRRGLKAEGEPLHELGLRIANQMISAGFCCVEDLEDYQMSWEPQSSLLQRLALSMMGSASPKTASKLLTHPNMMDALSEPQAAPSTEKLVLDGSEFRLPKETYLEKGRAVPNHKWTIARKDPEGFQKTHFEISGSTTLGLNVPGMKAPARNTDLISIAFSAYHFMTDEHYRHQPLNKNIPEFLESLWALFPLV